MMAVEIPIASPTAASPINTIASRPTETSDAATAGQRDARAMLNPSARPARAGSAAPRIPGSGTNTSAPPIRASTNRNPYSVASENVRLAGIPRQVSQQAGCIGHHLLKHPWEKQHQAHQEHGQPRDRTDRIVLDRGRDL